MKSDESSPKTRTQYGALPFRTAKDGSIEIMLVTSRETRRWVIPKGWPMKGLKPSAAAAREAREEAGLSGRISKRPIGSFTYQKRLKRGTSVPCTVEVFPLDVHRQAKRWPEQQEREGRWFSVAEAAAAVDEAELGELIRSLADRLGRPAESAGRPVEAAQDRAV